MSKLAIICAPDKAAISAMAEKISAGAISNGATADIFDATVDPAVLGGYDAAALGFGEGFAESEFLAVFSRCLPGLEGKKTAVFGAFEGKEEFAESLARVGKAARCVMLSVACTEEAAEELGRSLVHKKEIRPDLAKTVPIIFSTITGNGYKLAVAAAEAVPDHVGPYNIRYITDEVIDKFDTFVLSY